MGAGPLLWGVVCFLLSGGVAQAQVTPEAKLTASDAAFNDQFGDDVAVSGDTVVVGVQGADFPILGKSAGAVYVFSTTDACFITTGGAWTEMQKLTASDASGHLSPGGVNTFGSSVAIDGDTMVIGAEQKNGATGGAYVFTRSSTTGCWAEEAKREVSDGGPDDWFGVDAAISGDTIAIGAHRDDEKGNFAGAAYVFTRSGTTWTQEAKLTALDGVTKDQFGLAVAVDGDTAVVGAYFKFFPQEAAGAAYVFTRSGTTWTQQQRLLKTSTPARGYRLFRRLGCGRGRHRPNWQPWRGLPGIS